MSIVSSLFTVHCSLLLRERLNILRIRYQLYEHFSNRNSCTHINTEISKGSEYSPSRISFLDRMSTVKIELLSYSRAVEGHIIYVVDVSLDAEKWSLEKRFSDFSNLHYGILRKYAKEMENLAFPPKRWFGRFELSFLEERAHQLGEYLSALGALVNRNKRMRNDRAILDFMCPSNSSYENNPLLMAGDAGDSKGAGNRSGGGQGGGSGAVDGGGGGNLSPLEAQVLAEERRLQQILISFPEDLIETSAINSLAHRMQMSTISLYPGSNALNDARRLLSKDLQRASADKISGTGALSKLPKGAGEGGVSPSPEDIVEILSRPMSLSLHDQITTLDRVGLTVSDALRELSQIPPSEGNLDLVYTLS